MSHSAKVSAFLHINDGPSYPLGKVGPDEVTVHPSEQNPTYTTGQCKLAILEVTVDGKTNRRAVFVLSYEAKGRIRIRSKTYPYAPIPQEKDFPWSN
jgi:hypothetical protein